MPKIPNLLAFGKHCHNCGKWMERRALRKDLICNFCKENIFARNRKEMQMCSRCVECDNIVPDNFNYCECCGLETARHALKMKAREQQLKAKNSLSKLMVGDGQVPIEKSSGLITFPPRFSNFVLSKEELIDKVFFNIVENHQNYDWLSEQAILAAKNKDVDDLNVGIQNRIPGLLQFFKSVDKVINEDEATNYPTEFLNSLDLPGLPPHNLVLKVGSVVIMLRNLNQPKLCNGTRLVITKLMANVIHATILKGKFKGEEVLIPRIPMIPTEMPFEFKRIQFPIRLAFAMTINKSQGQSLAICGLDLENPCFAHGQLYVACSRVGKPSALFVFAHEEKTKNVVHNHYNQVLK